MNFISIRDPKTNVICGTVCKIWKTGTYRGVAQTRNGPKLLGDGFVSVEDAREAILADPDRYR